MRAALVFLAAVAMTVAGAETCPPGCTPAAKKKPAAKPAVHAAPVPGPVGPQGPKGDKGDKGDPGAIAPVNVVCSPTPCPVAEPIIVSRETYEGGWLAGAGPIYSRGWGLTGVGGYQWPSGWQLLVGPTWIPKNPTRGTGACSAGGSGHDSHGGGDPPPGGQDCGVPWEIPAGSQWGGQALLLYRFK